MKVLHVLNELKYSGAEIMYVDASPYFIEMGCELSVMATMPNVGDFADSFVSAGYHLIHRPLEEKSNIFERWKWYGDIVKFLKKSDYDVVHIHASRLRWGMSYCAWRAGIRSVYTFHNVFKCGKKGWLWHTWLRWSAKHIFKCKFQTISDSVYENEKNLYFNKTIKVYNWYGCDRFFPDLGGEKSKFRKELGIDYNALVLISVGGCSEIKRHTDIIKALPLIRKDHSNLLYLHLGEGAALSEEMRLVQEFGLTDIVRFCGNQKDVRRYLISSDIYLMPSKFEGISITTIEAMACKIPCILYNVPGLRDFNRGDERAIIIDEKYEELASSVISLQKNIEKKSTIVDKAYGFVNAFFNLKNNTQAIFDLYRQK